MTTVHLCHVCGASWIPSPSPATKPMFPEFAADDILTDVIKSDRRYKRDAYHFVLAGCQKIWEKQFAAGDFTPTHVTGARLLDVFREHALETYGPAAKSVLNNWGVFRCEDFGEIVFNLIAVERLHAQPGDTKEDFRNGYDFDTAFPESE